MIATRIAAIALLAAGAAAAPPALAKPRYAATITRTAEGVPHIVARDYGSLGYGSGYAAAEDNGCVIAETLVTVRGERSRWFGDKASVNVGFSDISNLESDVYHRTIGDLPALRAAQARTSADNRAIMAGFAAGYDRFLRDHPERFAESCRGAAWLSPITGDDMLLLVNAAMTLIGSAPYAKLVASALPPGAAPAGGMADVGPARLPDPALRAGLGSNGWAFGAERSANGRGILVGNPHFPWSGPNRFRRLHLTIPGRLDVMGGGLVFMPTVGIGFNRDVAWTHTVTTATHVTFFELKLDPADPTAYLVDGRREKMASRQVTIAVKDGAPVVRTLWSTRYGPVVALPAIGFGWTKERAFALRDADQANLRSGDAWLGIARARSVEEVRDVVSRSLGIPWINTIAADRAGHALYADITAVPNVPAAKLDACTTPLGKTPMARAASAFVLDGSRAACDWDVDPSTPVPGLMPASAQASLIRSDFVQNSNDSYWLANPAAPFAAHSPILGPVGVAQGLRTRSGIATILAAPAKLDLPMLEGMILANRVLAAEMIVPDLVRLCEGRADVAEACGVLARWDRRAELESRGAVLFFALWGKIAGRKDLWSVAFDPADPVNTPRGFNPAAAGPVLDALAAAAGDLKSRNLALDVPLGAVQVAVRGAERIGIHGGTGGAGVLNAMQSAPFEGGLTPYHGSSYLEVVTFAQSGPVAESLLSYAQSTNPESPHYADGTRAFSRKQWLKLPFTPAEIAAAREGDVVAISE